MPREKVPLLDVGITKAERRELRSKQRNMNAELKEQEADLAKTFRPTFQDKMAELNELNKQGIIYTNII